MIFFDKIGHLISDHSLQELHLFANKLGLKREWFQDKPERPHYDLTTTRARARAEAAGAILVDGREIVRLLKAAPYNQGNSLKDQIKDQITECWLCRYRTLVKHKEPCAICEGGSLWEPDEGDFDGQEWA
jgi:hypothetical protein